MSPAEWVEAMYALNNPERDDSVAHAAWTVCQESQFPHMAVMLGLEADPEAIRRPPVPGRWHRRTRVNARKK